MTPQELARCTGARIDRATAFLPCVESAMEEFGISTPACQAAFLAQVGHESGGLHWLTEIWGPTPAQARYEGRGDLGNTQAGDGYKFKGRGLIQITGRANYKLAGEALGVDLLARPDLLAEPEMAVRSAAWFWQSHGLNAFADAGDFDGVSDLINRGHKTERIGDANGYADRLALYTAAKEVLA